MTFLDVPTYKPEAKRDSYNYKLCYANSTINDSPTSTDIQAISRPYRRR